MKKNKKILIGLGLGVGAYLLWSLNRKKSTGVVEEISGRDTDFVKPKEKTKTLLHRGVESTGNSSNLGKQYVKINQNVFKTNPIKSFDYAVPQDAQYFIENDKGERRNVIRANRYGLVIDEKVIGKTMSKFLPMGESFIVYKENF